MSMYRTWDGLFVVPPEAQHRRWLVIWNSDMKMWWVGLCVSVVLSARQVQPQWTDLEWGTRWSRAVYILKCVIHDELMTMSRPVDIPTLSLWFSITFASYLGLQVVSRSLSLTPHCMGALNTNYLPHYYLKIFHKQLHTIPWLLFSFLHSYQNAAKRAKFSF